MESRSQNSLMEWNMIYSLDFRHIRKKLSPRQAKEKMQEVFKAKNYAIWDDVQLFPCILNIPNFNGTRPQFIQMVDNLDNRLFGFVITN